MRLGLGLGISNRRRGVQQSAMERYAFIDGEFFLSLLSFYSDEVDIDILGGIDWRQVRGFGRRVFWYDSLPAKKRNQTVAEHEVETNTKRMQLDEIDRQDGIFVRTGVSRFRQRDKKREQKGVDVLLAVDALQCAYKEQADEIHIYTSDLDFYPVFEALQGTKARGILHYQPSRVSDDLMRVADQAVPVCIGTALRLCGRGPGQDTVLFPGPTVVREESLRPLVLSRVCPEGITGVYFDVTRSKLVVAEGKSEHGLQVFDSESPILALERCRTLRNCDLDYSQLSTLKKEVERYR